MNTPTIPADHIDSPRAGSLGIGSPIPPAYVIAFVSAVGALQALEKRTGENLHLEFNEFRRAGEWTVVYADGTVVSEARTAGEAVGIAEELL